MGAGSAAAPVRSITTGDRRTVNILQAMELVGVSRRTIYNWMASNKIEFVRTAGGNIRIFEDTLWRLPNEQESK